MQSIPLEIFKYCQQLELLSCVDYSGEI